MRTLRIPLRVVFYKSDGKWLAHCLEFDLLGDGPSQEAALENLDQAVHLQIAHSVKHDNPQNLFNPADGEYYRMFAAGHDVSLGELHLSFPGTEDVGGHRGKLEEIKIGRVDYREYADSEENKYAMA